MTVEPAVTGDMVQAAAYWWDHASDDEPPPPPDDPAWKHPSWGHTYSTPHGLAGVEHVPAYPWDRGTCDCGWRGEPRWVEMAAWVDVLNHLHPAWAESPVRRWDRDWKPTRKAPTRPAADQANGVPYVRNLVCGPGTNHGDGLGLCRGSIPLPVLEMCAHSAHWDPEASRRWRFHVNGVRARQEEERDRRLVYANAPLVNVVRAEGGMPARAPGVFGSGACEDGDHLFCRWIRCVCPCHSAWFLPERREAQRRYGALIMEGWVRPYGPPAPPPPPPARPEPTGQLALF